MIGYGEPRRGKERRARSSGCLVRYAHLNPYTQHVCPNQPLTVAFFHQVLIGTIRSEIASCSEKAYPSLPIANAKNLLFLESEGSVVQFAQERGWVVKDGRIYFPLQQGDDLRTEKEILVASGQVIENTIGYARELETIV
jgi:hypothetical protein